MNQPLRLSKKEIIEFIKAHKEVSGEDLDFEKAEEMATKLMALTVFLVTKERKSDYNEVTTN